MKTILIIGGAGYVGSHQVKLMCNLGYEVIVVDNLNTGFRYAVDKRAKFLEGDLRDYEFMTKVFTDNKIDGVIHFAALSLVGESVEKPLEYFDNNIGGMHVLLKVMVENDVKNLVFSSTAATYGTHEVMPITEEYATNPENPYGESKLMMEQMIKWCARSYDMNFLALRYFNVCGASLDGTIGENHNPETHLIPIVLQVPLGIRDFIGIYGDDYDTADGTCIRDYIHVEDLANAHVCAIEKLFEAKQNSIINLGYGHGYSVKEIIDTARKVTGHPIPEKVTPRRAGDPAALVAKNDKARKVLGWEPKYDDIELIIKSAYDYHKSVINNEN
ncbi:UDP-glucose 4-epimerase GalE [Mollicutes bacterium LVI A0078]|nr:UDP-glucose 4-epimerase GalE [Mollicutes bacterium LVI A0075]WOO90385.1 UDP-glucose 4-epimerase GalE [Mollicutes bacterium LVI A0078]